MASFSNRLSQQLLTKTSHLPRLCSWVRNNAGKAYVPLIKFRYGSGKTQKKVATTSSPTTSMKGKATAATAKSAKSTAIEDWEIPKRYQRKRMSKTEMDYINCGGPP